MEQHITELLGYIGIVGCQQGIGELIYLLYGVGAKTFVGLLAVPRTLHSQAVEGIDHSSEGFDFFLTGMHFGNNRVGLLSGIFAYA